MTPLAFTADLSDVRQQLTQQVQTAQTELSRLQATISRDRGQLAQQINAAQNRVLDLREKTVAARRSADETTLSLRQIESRLKAWREQSEFQSRLVAAFLDRSGKRSLSEGAQSSYQNDLGILAGYLTEQRARLYPDWRDERLVLPSGQIEPVRALSLGPVQWFWQQEQQRAGLTKDDQNVLSVGMLFGDAARAGIQSLYQDSEGTVTFDPTLSRALLLAGDHETLMQHLQKGGIWVIPILLFALFATVTAVIKAAYLYRLPPLLPALAERVRAVLAEPAALETLVQQVRGLQAELLKIALAPQSAEHRDEQLYAALLGQRNRLERWLGAIALTASISPLLGLLGTISGMIATFKLMTLFGAGDASSVSAGISEALVTTELGLVVAVPALITHALMSRKAKSYFAQLETDAVHLSQLPTAGQPS